MLKETTLINYNISTYNFWKRFCKGTVHIFHHIGFGCAEEPSEEQQQRGRRRGDYDEFTLPYTRCIKRGHQTLGGSSAYLIYKDDYFTVGKTRLLAKCHRLVKFQEKWSNENCQLITLKYPKVELLSLIHPNFKLCSI